MKKNLYTIHDKVAEENGPVFEAKNDGIALRSYQGILKDSNSLFTDEFSLMYIGTIDKESNVITQDKNTIREVKASLKMETENE